MSWYATWPGTPYCKLSIIFQSTCSQHSNNTFDLTHLLRCKISSVFIHNHKTTPPIISFFYQKVTIWSKDGNLYQHSHSAIILGFIFMQKYLCHDERIRNSFLGGEQLATKCTCDTGHLMGGWIRHIPGQDEGHSKDSRGGGINFIPIFFWQIAYLVFKQLFHSVVLLLLSFGQHRVWKNQVAAF